MHPIHVSLGKIEGVCAAAVIGIAAMLFTTPCSAQTAAVWVREQPTHRHLEIEVHGDFAYAHGIGLGAGGRVGIPILTHGPVPRINNSLAVSVGADLVWWPNVYLAPACAVYSGGVCIAYNNTAYSTSQVSLMIHADAQWNVYLTPRWSVFAEVGFSPEFMFCGNACQVFWAWPDFAVGGRLHFGRGNGNSYPALTMRLGFPATTIGVSF